MPEFMEDDIVWPTMVKMAACLETTVAARGLPGLCRCTPVPGPLAVIEAIGQKHGGDCAGMGWVRLDTNVPSSTFPTVDQRGGHCATPEAFTLEVGIARKQEAGKASAISGFVPPTANQQVQSTRLQTADMRAIKLAIQCCLADPKSDDDISYILNGYQTISLPGDSGGGFWRVTIWSV